MKTSIALCAIVALGIGCGGGESTTDGGGMAGDGSMMPGLDGGMMPGLDGSTPPGEDGGPPPGVDGGPPPGPFEPQTVIVFESTDLGRTSLIGAQLTASGSVLRRLSHDGADVTQNLERVYMVAISSDGSLVAYVSSSTEVWVGPTNASSPPTQIGTSSDPIGSIAFTPDGAWVLYTTQEPPGPLVSLAVDGSGEVRLSENAKDVKMSSTSQIAFTEEDPTGADPLDAVIVSPDGTGEVRISGTIPGVTGAHDPDGELGSPISWSPDGAWLAVTSRSTTTSTS